MSDTAAVKYSSQSVKRRSFFYEKFDAQDQLSIEDKSKLFALWKPFMKEGIREAWIAGDYCHAWSASPAYWMRKKGFFE